MKTVSLFLALLTLLLTFHLLDANTSSHATPNTALTLTEVASGFWRVSDIAATGVATDTRLFVVEQAGRIHIVENGSVRTPPFLDISALVESGGNEQGLLGLVFDPDYAQNRFFYVNYTAIPDGRTIVARYQTRPDDPNQADPNSAVEVLSQEQPNQWHNAGDLTFGPDGYLYIPLGDGGGVGDPFDNAQDLSTLLGAVLRLDVRTLPYAIPPDNPFAQDGDPNTRDEIWAYGLRNPWRFSFDRETGDLYIADVGQNEWEEINRQPANSSGGENYGWDCYEGAHPYGNAAASCAGTPVEALTFPILEYAHTPGGVWQHCAVIGGFVYRGAALPYLNGAYFFADYCSGALWMATPNGATWRMEELSRELNSPTTFGEDNAGELYIAERGGRILRLEGPPATWHFVPLVHR